MDKFIRNCIFAMLIVFTLIQLERLLNSYSRDGNRSASSSNSKTLDVFMNTIETQHVKHCEATVMKIRHRHKKMFKRNREICTTHHTYMASGKRVLIEVGGNVGKDAEIFQTLYKPRHIILEPNSHYHEILKNKFKANKRVTVLNFGLAAHSGHYSAKEAGKEADATSIYSNRKGSTSISVMNSTVFFKNLGVGSFEVDLLSLDCEGCEFEVLESMLVTNMTTLFKNIQIEWHARIVGISDQTRYCKIIAMLSRTHRPTFRYHYIYENWRRKGLP